LPVKRIGNKFLVLPGDNNGYIGSTLDVVYRKLKVVEAPITFAIGS
jgi:hypothetical protein